MPLTRDLPAVAALAPWIGRPLVIADVGCRWGFADAWRAFGRNATIIGFDPDEAECARLQSLASADQDTRFVPRALGAKRGRATFHRAQEPACSSLYPPDEEMIRHRPANHLCTPVGVGTVELSTLDDWAAESGVRWVDGLKLDTQGADLDVLRGSKRMLPTIRMLEVEVMFNPIYVGQPLFGDVDRFLRDRGFQLWRLCQLVHYGMAGASGDYHLPDRQYFDSTPVEFPSRGGQLSWGHAYYVPREMAYGVPHREWQGAIRDACLAAAFGFRDLAADSLRRGWDAAPPEAATAMRAAVEG